MATLRGHTPSATRPAVLEQITATPRRAPRRLAIAAVAAVTVAAAAVALLSSGAKFDAAARAYAQTAPGPHLLPVVVGSSLVCRAAARSVSRTMPCCGVRRPLASHRPRRPAGRQRRRAPRARRSGSSPSATSCAAACRTARSRPSDSIGTDEQLARRCRSRATFIAAFPRRYESHALRDAGGRRTPAAVPRLRGDGRRQPRRPGVARPAASAETCCLGAETALRSPSTPPVALYVPGRLGPDHKVVPPTVQTGAMRSRRSSTASIATRWRPGIRRC